MGATKYINELWRRKQTEVMRLLSRVRCWEYRQGKTICRLTKPTRPERAKRLGYKNKPGFVIYRVRVRRGDRKKKVRKGIVYGKPVHQGVTKMKMNINLKSIGEGRIGKRCKNLRVLNSYWINQDNMYKYYEVILMDPSHSEIRNDPRTNWVCNSVHKGREQRGLTSAGKKHRGLRHKGYGAHCIRPSVRGNWKRRNTLKLKRIR